MKRKHTILITLLFAISLSACAGSQPSPSPSPVASSDPVTLPEDIGPVAVEVRGVTIPAFNIYINGIEVTQDTVAAYPMYSVQAKSVNSSGTESIVTYEGFAIKDILDAIGLAEDYIWLEARASDGYTVTLTGSVIHEDTTLLAMTKDGSPFSAMPWLAPCSDQVTGNYLKGTASILVNTSEGVPEIINPDKSEDNSAKGLPEINDITDGVTFERYSFLVNGIEVTNETLDGLRIFRITAVNINKSGAVSEATYTGYKLADVLEACGLSDYTTVKAVANDGYESTLAQELIDSDHTLLAIEKDKEPGENGTVWLAPCSVTTSGTYCKLVEEIIVE